MKKLLLPLFLAALLCLSACSSSNVSSDVATESVPADYGRAIELAKSEFDSTFASFDGLELAEITTMTRTEDNSNVVVQIAYSSNNGDGIYGFEFQKDKDGNYEILQQGDRVTIDNLAK